MEASRGEDSAHDITRMQLVPGKGQKTGESKGLETACATLPHEGNGKGDVKRGFFFSFLKRDKSVS